MALDVEGLRRHLGRDWARVRRNKAESWAARTPAERIEAAWNLREHLISVQPGWPSPQDRKRDLAHHRARRALHLRLRERGL